MVKYRREGKQMEKTKKFTYLDCEAFERVVGSGRTLVLSEKSVVL